MSFILDALRKAEQERVQSSGPRLGRVAGQPTVGGRPLWPWILGVLLLVNAGLAAWYLGAWSTSGTRVTVVTVPEPRTPTPWPSERQATADRTPVAKPSVAKPKESMAARAPASEPALPPRTATRETPARADAGSAPAPAGASPPAPSITPPRSAMSAPGGQKTASPPPPAPVREPKSQPPAPVVETRPQPAPSAPAAVSPRPRVAAPVMPADAAPVAPRAEARATPPAPRLNLPGTRPPSSDSPAARSGGSLPRTLEEMPQDFKASVPRLRVDVLMYSESDDEAMVFINGRKYTAGQSVEGLTLEAIRPEGVILSLRGERFLLRAQ